MVSITWAVVLFTATAAVATPSSRIIGGQEVPIEQYPSIVQIEYLIPVVSIWRYSCGATIVSNSWLVSSAQCFSGRSFLGLSSRRMRAGTSVPGEGGFIVRFSSYLNHPDFNKKALYDSDITLLRLVRPLTWSAAVQPAPINLGGSELPDNSPVVVAGFGAVEADTSEEMTDLQEAAVFTVNTEECRRRYKDFLNENVTDTMICAGLLDVGGVDACIRDTGGPLYYNNDNSNVDVLVGIVSWGFWRACGDFTFPGVYTQVSAFTDWILANAV
ncbi:hypothetical protein JYU34_020597 [Plutella xylostella]|uniref:Uncharacterized protein n=2 Tax=Plutella xylostella TaxID=51655 RepID=A0ABQ7PWB2_PLUXY|nr:trypsin, alkaline C [Plutella xylostella]KAG7296715.1 hypothetical protein JYU34_020597 [Plutella xylostella]CAG9122418.1 unnamed protein product [Plutella xylostella]